MTKTSDLSQLYKGLWISDERRYKATFSTGIDGARRNHATLRAAKAHIDETLANGTDEHGLFVQPK